MHHRVETQCGRNLAAFLPSIGLQRVATDGGSHKKTWLEYLKDGKLKKWQEILWCQAEMPETPPAPVLSQVDLNMTELSGNRYFLWSHITKSRFVEERDGMKIWTINDADEHVKFLRGHGEDSVAMKVFYKSLAWLCHFEYLKKIDDDTYQIIGEKEQQ